MPFTFARRTPKSDRGTLSVGDSPSRSQPHKKPKVTAHPHVSFCSFDSAIPTDCVRPTTSPDHSSTGPAEAMEMDVSETSHLPSSQGSYHPKERTGGSIGSDDPKEENVGKRQLLPAKSLSTSPDPLHGPTGSSSAIVAAVPGCVIVGSSSHQSDNATTAPALASPPRNPDCVERTDVTTVLPSPEIPVQLGIQPPLSSTKSTTVPGKPRSLGKHKKPPSTKSITVTLTSPQRSTVSPSLCHLDLFEPLIPTPTCLMYVPVQLHGVDFRALIDSGASDNFISSGICDHLRLSRHPLKEPLTMQLADGSYTSVGSYTRPHLKIGE